MRKAIRVMNRLHTTLFASRIKSFLFVVIYGNFVDSFPYSGDNIIVAIRGYFYANFAFTKKNKAHI